MRLRALLPCANAAPPAVSEREGITICQAKALVQCASQCSSCGRGIMRLA